MFDDKRVREYWDGDLTAGAWFGDHLDEIGAGRQTGGVYWDAFLLFDAAARWRTVPAPLTASGSTVIDESPRLQASITSLLQ